MNSAPPLNSVPLRRLIRRHGNLGYLLVGFYLAGYWLYHFKRRQTIAILTLAMAAGAFTFWTGPYRLSHGNTQTQTGIRAAYKITDLGIVSGYEYSFGEAINNKGQVAGDIADEEFDTMHGFFHSGNKMSDMGTLGGEISLAFGINDNGQVVGIGDTREGEIRGFVWQNGKMTRIGTLGGQISVARGINNKGEVVGIAATSSGEGHAFVWKDGSLRDISGKCPGEFNSANVINDNSDIAGIFSTDGRTVQPFVLSGNTSRPIPTLGGDFAIPACISNKAHVVGYSNLKPGDFDVIHGFAWQPGGIKDLGTLGGDSSAAYGVNSSGQIVGVAETSGEMFHAVTWKNGAITDLNKLIPSGSGWELVVANGINERGQITGWGIVGDTAHAFVLTPQD